MSPSPEEVARAHRLRSLADMAGGMAHEFNQPLTVIRGCAENLLIARQRGWQLPPERIEDKLGTIIAQCDRISGLIEDVRRFARGAEDLASSAFPVLASVDDALLLMRVQLAARGIAVEVAVAAALRAQGDRHGLADVLIELLRNARAAIAGSGRAQGSVRIAGTVADGLVRLEVADDGPGLDAAAVREPFAGGGSGLGLPIARRTMEAMGGSLAIAGRPGAGTVVTLSLRLAADG